MITKKILFVGIMLCSTFAFSQNVGINTTGTAPDASAGLDVDFPRKGVLIPRVSLTAKNAAAPITSPANSLLVYNTATAGTAPNNVTPGYYYWYSSEWVRLLAGSDTEDGKYWRLDGNSGVTASHFLGPINNTALMFRTNNVERMRILANGKVAVNATTTFTGSTFFSQATGNNSAIDGDATGTGDAVFGQNTGTGNALYGISNNSNGLALRASNLSATGTGISAVGNNQGGVILTMGSAGAFIGERVGVFSKAATTNSAVSSAGVLGVSSSGLNTMLVGGSGVSGVAGTNGTGVFAHNSGSGTALVAMNNGATSFAVDASNSHADGTGIIAAGNNAVGEYITEGSGVAATGTALGTFSKATNTTNGHGLLAMGNNQPLPNLPGVGLGVGGAGSRVGVYGRANNATNGHGVLAFGNNRSALYISDGAGLLAAGVNTGAYGGANATDGTGVVASGNAGNMNTLVSGSGVASSGTEVGVYGLATNSTGTGMLGVGNNTTGSTLTAGSGVAGTGTNTGVFGYGNNTSSGTGVLGAGNGLTGSSLTDGSGGAFTGSRAAIYGYSTAALISSGLLIHDPYGNQWDVGHWSGSDYYKILGPGLVSTVVKDLNEEDVILVAPEAPEALFQDYGIGKLTHGKTYIKLDPILSKNISVSEARPMKVFIQLEGECNGVYVTNKSADGFEVIELNNGNSNVEFSYSIVATRANEVFYNKETGEPRVSDYSGRFVKRTGIEESVKAETETKEKKQSALIEGESGNEFNREIKESNRIDSDIPTVTKENPKGVKTKE